MVLIQPEDLLKLNIPEIDAQHEALIGLINRIHDNMLQGADRPALDGLLSQLLAHTRDHFAYEEALMSQHDYPGYEAHRSEHHRLLQHIEDLAGRYKSGDLLLSFAVIVELKGWAAVHIEKSDRRLGEFLKN